MSETTAIALIVGSVAVIALLLFNKVRIVIQLKALVISLDAGNSKCNRSHNSRSDR